MNDLKENRCKDMVPRQKSGYISFISLVLLLIQPHLIHGFTSDPKTIDLTAALELEDYTTSQYIVDKNYNFYLANTPSDPSKKEKSEWFTRFIAEQALIAELRRQKWTDRPEIADAVNSMERYLLFQDEGPFFENVIPTIPLHSEAVKTIRQQAKTKVSGTFIQISDYTARNLGAVEKYSKIESLIESIPTSNNISSNITLHWPFNPFMGIKEQVSNAKVEELYGPFHEQGTLLYFQLSSKNTNSTLYDKLSDSQFSEHAAQIDRAIRLNQYKYSLKKEARLTIQQQPLIDLAQRVAIDEKGKLLLNDTTLAGSELFEYRFKETRHIVSIADFIADYNNSIQRQLLDDPSKIKEAIDYYVLSRQCLLLSNSSGVTDAPRYTQNRLNYENNCLLEKYKEDVIKKSIDITESDIKQAFQRQYKDATKPIRIEGNIYRFNSLEAAIIGDIKPESSRRILISESSKPIFEGWPTQTLLSMPDGARIGPVPQQESFLVFEKIKTVENRPITLEEKRKVLIRKLLDEHYQTQLLNDLQQRTANLKVRIDFSKYGLEQNLANH